MKIADSHCDLLMKMYLDPSVEFSQTSHGADVSYPRLKKGGVALQVFAIFLPERLRQPSFTDVLEQIELFRRKIASHADVCFVRTREDLEESERTGKMAAILSLEGADALAGDFTLLRTAHALGVRLLGITWNHANWAADGVGEPRKGGFTVHGRQLVKECEKLGMVLDVSHLSETGFWELAELSARPFIASHSNCKALCPHPRNLTDDQIRAIIAAGGRIGVTFVPYFVTPKGATIADVLRHVERICGLGGERYLGFGSDFDGNEEWIPRLEHPGQYGNLAGELLKHYGEETVKGFMYGNWRRFMFDNFL